MTIVLLVGLPVAAGIAYAVWMARRLQTPPRPVRPDDVEGEEPAVSLDFWEQRRAR